MTPLRAKLPFDYAVCSVEEATGHCDALWPNVVLSLFDPGRALPDWNTSTRRHHIERFHDIPRELPNQVAPQYSHVKRILGFTSDIKDGDKFLVHCAAGVSRSTAVLILTLIQHGLTPSEALAEVLRIRPQAYPNPRVIELGDRILGLSFEVVKVVQDWQRTEMAKAIMAKFPLTF